MYEMIVDNMVVDEMTVDEIKYCHSMPHSKQRNVSACHKNIMIVSFQNTNSWLIRLVYDLMKTERNF